MNGYWKCDQCGKFAYSINNDNPPTGWYTIRRAETISAGMPEELCSWYCIVAFGNGENPDDTR